jgi:glycosyltransferase involved in cell wall biosynthesis
MTGTVLLLTPVWGGHDGLSVLAAQYASALDEITDGRVHVWALVSHEADGAEASPARTIRVRGFGGRRTTLGRAAITAALDCRPQCVITLHVNQLPVAAPFVAAGVPLTHVLVGIESWRRLSGVRAAVLRRASRMLAISHHSARQFSDANPHLARPDVAVVHPHAPSLPAPAASSSAGDGFAMIVGRMSAEERYKGHDTLIDLWPSVRALAPGARLLCVGGGDDLPRIRARVQEAGLGDAIACIGGVSSNELAVLYRDCAFLVMPSRREGFGLVFLEAMRAGRPCIGAAGSAEEIIEHGVSGTIVSDGADCLRAALVEMFTDPSRRASFGRASCLRARTVFSRERFVDRLRAQLAEHLQGS